MAETQEFQQRIARIESLTRALEGTSSPSVRALAKELTQAVMDLHGTAIERMLELIHAGGPQGMAMIDSLAGDPLIGSLLVLYGLHPLDIRSRVEQALERLQPTFRKHQARVELTGVEDGVVHLRISPVANAASGRAVKSAIEEMVYALAPDVARIEGLHTLGASELVEIQTLVAAGKGED